MAFDSRVYRILIASPSDVQDEREIAVQVIQEWNNLYSASRKVVLLPLRWETHTAPEYGARPQDVINRAIVDDCDLLLGLFWAKIGSPTGASDSGTLEEIERADKAGKPIMLYFSRIGVNPEDVDLRQLQRLNEFRNLTYKNALIEHYTSHIDFRDKLSRQLEMRVRTIQARDVPGAPPLSLCLVLPNGSNLGSDAKHNVTVPQVQDVDAALQGTPKERIPELKAKLDERIRDLTAFTVIPAIGNTGAFGIRYLYVELQITADKNSVTVTQYNPYARPKPWTPKLPLDTATIGIATYLNTSAYTRAFDSVEYDPQCLTGQNGVWQMVFEWDAIQPQRMRCLTRWLFISTQEPATLHFVATVYADSFPKPVEISARLELVPEMVPTVLKDVVGDVDDFKSGMVTLQWKSS